MSINTISPLPYHTTITTTTRLPSPSSSYEHSQHNIDPHARRVRTLLILLGTCTLILLMMTTNIPHSVSSLLFVPMCRHIRTPSSSIPPHHLHASSTFQSTAAQPHVQDVVAASDTTTNSGSNNNDDVLSSMDNGHNGTLIAYTYYETANAMENAAFFFMVGVQPYLNDSRVHFLIILSSNISIDLPSGTNIFVHHRQNVGMDICAYNETMREPFISTQTGHSLSKYRYIIWMNASVRGPFLPVGFGWTDWLPYFLHQISERDKLIGTSINCYHHLESSQGRNHMKKQRAIGGDVPAYRAGNQWPLMHLQSMFMAFDYHILPIMLRHLPCMDSHKMDVVKLSELRFTQAVLSEGYNIRSQMAVFRRVNWLNVAEGNAACQFDHDWNVRADNLNWHESWRGKLSRKRNEAERSHLLSGDRQFTNAYHGISIHPYEIVFFKSNRDITPEVVARYTEWTLNQAYQYFGGDAKSYHPHYRSIPPPQPSQSPMTSWPPSSLLPLLGHHMLLRSPPPASSLSPPSPPPTSASATSSPSASSPLFPGSANAAARRRHQYSYRYRYHPPHRNGDGDTTAES